MFSLIIGSILGTDIFSNIDVSGSVENETLLSLDNITNSTLSIKSTYAGATCSLASLVNYTDGTIISPTNYTFYNTECNIILVDSSLYIGENVNATYTYTYASENTLSGINVDALSTMFSSFIVAITSFIVVGGTLLGILWILPYIKPLFKKDALGISA